MVIQNIPNPNAVANAYGNTQNVSKPGVSGGDFAGLVKDSIAGTIDQLKNSEQVSAKAVAGEASAIDVVQAVTSAELSLQTLVSVRDRLLSAYQEILRMPI